MLERRRHLPAILRATRKSEVWKERNRNPEAARLLFTGITGRNERDVLFDRKYENQGLDIRCDRWEVYGLMNWLEGLTARRVRGDYYSISGCLSFLRNNSYCSVKLHRRFWKSHRSLGISYQIWSEPGQGLRLLAKAYKKLFDIFSDVFTCYFLVCFCLLSCTYL